MKAVLSQTLFANLSTIPADAIDDNITQVSEVPDSGIVLTTDKFVSDFDSNGWPQSGRNRAISKFRKAFATHIAGDQHLGSTLQYGIDNWRDAGYAIVSPATGCIWTRRWHPPVEGNKREDNWPPNLGDFEDGFGNKITVYAVANPHKPTIEPTRHHELSTGIDNPVIRITRERTGEMVYTLRINGNSFQPGVFAYGNYIIEIGEPDNGRWKKSEGINATSFKERQPLEVVF